ncbi:MAG: hypothetical protein KDE45_20385 [Caldilineaceae bacterium]|nr:hypothetical protein [Caldilineaceae bacterium]
MSTQVSATTGAAGNHHDHDYDSFIQRMNARFLTNCARGEKPLFTTDAAGLWQIYLDSFTDPGERQYHNCSTCRHFIERYGALAAIDENGMLASAIWNEDDAPELYKPAIAAMAKAVRRAKVTGVFLSSYSMWGVPETGAWRHFAVQPTPKMVFSRTTQTAGQAMAEKREDFNNVVRALAEFKLEHLETAMRLLKSDALYRTEKVIGPAEWLYELKVARNLAHGSQRTNLVWLAVATAPAGFCHPRASMIGTLLEDIAAGKSYDEVAAAFAAKMHPLRYQRPQAAPAAGTIAAAERRVQELGIRRSLPRRFARLDEVRALWRPTPKKNDAPADGVFGHLKPKTAKPASAAMNIPAQTMTWVKFRDEVLPTAERIELKAPAHGPYVALVTAVNMDAPPILQWDQEDARNPVSWYFWNGGSTARSFGLNAGNYVEVEAVALKPPMWNGGYEHHGKGVMFVLAGAHETRQAGAALFPENMKNELHGVRSVIEAYSKSATIEGMNEPHAAGIMFTPGHGTIRWNCTLRVWSNGQPLTYQLDRWD